MAEKELVMVLSYLQTMPPVAHRQWRSLKGENWLKRIWMIHVKKCSCFLHTSFSFRLCWNVLQWNFESQQKGLERTLLKHWCKYSPEPRQHRQTKAKGKDTVKWVLSSQFHPCYKFYPSFSKTFFTLWTFYSPSLKRSLTKLWRKAIFPKQRSWVMSCLDKN